MIPNLKSGKKKKNHPVGIVDPQISQLRHGMTRNISTQIISGFTWTIIITFFLVFKDPLKQHWSFNKIRIGLKIHEDSKQ